MNLAIIVFRLFLVKLITHKKVILTYIGCTLTFSFKKEIDRGEGSTPSKINGVAVASNRLMTCDWRFDSSLHQETKA